MVRDDFTVDKAELKVGLKQVDASQDQVQSQVRGFELTDEEKRGKRSIHKSNMNSQIDKDELLDA